MAAGPGRLRHTPPMRPRPQQTLSQAPNQPIQSPAKYGASQPPRTAGEPQCGPWHAHCRPGHPERRAVRSAGSGRALDRSCDSRPDPVRRNGVDEPPLGWDLSVSPRGDRSPDRRGDAHGWRSTASPRLLVHVLIRVGGLCGRIKVQRVDVNEVRSSELLCDARRPCGRRRARHGKICRSVDKEAA